MAKKAYLLPVVSEFFSTYLPKTSGLSDNTIRSYKHAFRLLFEYVYQKQGLIPEKLEFRHVEGGVIEDWLNWLRSERKCSEKTRNHRHSALVTFSRFAFNRDFDNAMTLCSEVKHLPKTRTPISAEAIHFTKEEMTILLRLPNSMTEIGKRDKAVLSTLYASGARVQELCDLTVGDVRFGKSTTLTLHGKGNKTRTIVIPEQGAALLKSYMGQNHLLRKDAVEGKHIFSSQTHEHMTTSCIRTIVKKYVTIAKKRNPGLFRENYTPHSFRHSIAMHMLESGIPLPVIKTFLGHESIASTLIYASANYEMVNSYLRDKDPYAENDVDVQPNLSQLPQFSMPRFLR